MPGNPFMDEIRTIIVGMDFSPAAISAARQARRMAAWHGARVIAAHVADVLVGVTLGDALAPCSPGIAEAVLADADRTWKGLSPEISEGTEFLALIGSPTAELKRIVRENQADLLLLGMRGTSASGRGVGTHASQLVRHAAADVLLAADGQDGPFRNIVACVDFSETSRRALLDAARLAARDGAALHVVHVYRTPWAYTPPPAGSPKRNHFHEEYATAILRGLTEFGEQHGPEVARAGARYALVENANHARGIAAFAESVGADLVVLGTRGRTSMRDLLLGSTAERVLREASCSVLTVPPTETVIGESGRQVLGDASAGREAAE